MTFVDHRPPPKKVDRVVIHQFDPARPSPGGIDTCLRGVCRYIPVGTHLAAVGVDTGSGPISRKLGVWERHRLGEQEFWFLPVAELDPADQARRIPHVLRLIWGVMKYRSRLPERRTVQVHRMDSAAFLSVFLREPQLYCVHTQENGLVGQTSDSFWRFLGGAHRVLEKSVARKASAVVVFNETYSEVVRAWNPQAVFSPTWFDPALIVQDGPHGEPHTIIWVGRLETPKDPELAIHAFAALVDRAPKEPWKLKILGSGTLEPQVRQAVDDCAPDVKRRIELLGRVAPEDVATLASEAGLFLMTSFPGYEGYPRVLVEAMAAGLPAVVTDGSDTGGIVVEGATGFTCTRDPRELAEALQRAQHIPRENATSAVAAFDAPTLVSRMFAMPSHSTIVQETVR